MPAFSTVNGAALLEFLGIGAGGAVGSFSARAIDAREAAIAPNGDIAEEYAYCAAALAAAGYNVASLTDDEYGKAKRALVYGAAYRYVQLAISSMAVQPTTKDGAGILQAYNTNAAHYYARADLHYTELGIVSKYRDDSDKPKSASIYY